mmetsp:Transcript_9182/g.13771  ORF Transcript_9182/g.13771 Transcript_9182/m.13771 type:complete len:273 (-) Transcript_9182:230-1048(-)
MLIRPIKRRKRLSVRLKKLPASLTTLSVPFVLRSCLALKKLMIPRSKKTALDLSKMLLTKPRERKISGRRISRRRHHSGTVQSSTTHLSFSQLSWQQGQESTKNFAKKKMSELSLKQRRESLLERESVRQTRLGWPWKQRSLQRRLKLTGRPRRSVNGKKKNEGSAKKSWRRKSEFGWKSKEKENRGSVLNVLNLPPRREERRGVSMSPHPVVEGEAIAGEEEEAEEDHHLTEAVVMVEDVTKDAMVAVTVAEVVQPQRIAVGLRSYSILSL